jgi:CHAD domain-containing protein
MPQPNPLPRYGPRDRLSDVGPRVVRARLRDARRYEPSLLRALRKGPPDADDVHDMRVALRRLRAALAFLDIDPHVQLEVKRLQDALGGIRDVQVQEAWLHAHARPRGSKRGDALEEPRQRLLARLPAGSTHLREELERWRALTLGRLQECLRAGLPRFRIGGKHVRRELRQTLRKIQRRFSKFEKSADPITAHRLRIAIKKLRYEAELLIPVWPQQMGALLRTLKPLQEAFGALHDADVRISMLEQVGDSEKPAALGRVLQGTENQRRKLAAQASATVGACQVRRQLRALAKKLKDNAAE